MVKQEGIERNGRVFGSHRHREPMGVGRLCNRVWYHKAEGRPVMSVTSVTRSPKRQREWTRA
jgi:hypothetical protein